MHRALKPVIHNPFNGEGGMAGVKRAKGRALRLRTALTALALPSLASPAGAATIVILADPMTMNKRTVVLDTNGPDRAYLCMLPPGQAGCQRLNVKRMAR